MLFWQQISAGKSLKGPHKKGPTFGPFVVELRSFDIIIIWQVFSWVSKRLSCRLYRRKFRFLRFRSEDFVFDFAIYQRSVFGQCP